MPARSTAPRLALALLGALLVAGATAASAKPSLDVGRKDVWKVGDVVTTTTHDDDSVELRDSGPDATAAPVAPQRVKTAAVRVEKCLEIDADANRSKVLVWFSSWSYEKGPTKDESLKGVFVDVVGRGKDRAYSVRPSATPPSKIALAWLAKKVGPGSNDPEATRRAWLPKGAVAVGDEWAADLGAVLSGPSAAWIDRAKAKSSARLDSLEGATGVLTLRASLPLSKFNAPKGGEPIPWTKGGIEELKGSLSVSLVSRLASTVFLMSETVEGETQLNGRTIAISKRSDRSVETRNGGDMPEPPAGPAPGPPPAVPPADGTPTQPPTPPTPAPTKPSK